MKKLRRAILLLFVAGLLLAPVAWWFWPHLRSEYAMRVISGVDETDTFRTKTIVSVNTFDDEVSSEFIKERYNRAARILFEKSKKTRTYKSTDPESWGHVVTVLANRTGYVYVSAGSGNDSETFSVGQVAGNFDDSEMALLPDWNAPRGLFRCDWSQSAEQATAQNPDNR